jgi:HAD superfamily hydrolase (TIGR01509 family)
MKAVIFDMDGVIVDSELQWQRCEGEFFRKHVPTWCEADHHKIVGLGVEDLYHFLAREYSISAGKEQFLKECHDIAALVYNERCSLTPGFTETLAEIKRRGLLLGLASSSPRLWILAVLRRFGLEDTFKAMACADDVPSGKTKPEPDIYLEALRRVGVSAGEAIAIEDSALGLRAAKRAGMACAAFRNGSNDAQDFSAADFEIRSLAEILPRLPALSA